ncbi:MAG: ABC transporter substrate-binding protein [Betaproteobacteria bacterium]
MGPPTSWDDLLSGRLRGEISMANPVSSGTGYTVLATLVQLMGEFRLPTNRLAAVPRGAVPLDAVEVVAYDLVWAAAHKQRLVEAWNLVAIARGR